MAPKTKTEESTSTKKPVESVSTKKAVEKKKKVVKEEPTVVEEPVVAKKVSTRGTKKKVKEEVKEEPVAEEVKEEEVAEEVKEDVAEEVADEIDLSTAMGVNNTIAGVITSLKEEIVKAKADKNRDLVASLTSICKTLTTTKKPIEKLSKTKKVRKVSENKNTGFHKPIQVTEEMSKFAGWTAGELKSRVDVTKSVCSYIKEKDLQNPENKREILVDGKLKKLLRYDADKHGPLTYYRIQALIQPHFVKV